MALIDWPGSHWGDCCLDDECQIPPCKSFTSVPDLSNLKKEEAWVDLTISTQDRTIRPLSDR